MEEKGGKAARFESRLREEDRRDGGKSSASQEAIFSTETVAADKCQKSEEIVAGTVLARGRRREELVRL